MNEGRTSHGGDRKAFEMMTSHVQLFSSVEASTSYLACFQCFLLSSFYLLWIMLRLIRRPAVV
jgi:hypothetical protein